MKILHKDRDGNVTVVLSDWELLAINNGKGESFQSTRRINYKETIGITEDEAWLMLMEVQKCFKD